ncbi:MAG: hypothetical protein IGR76_12095 [Synechococcales cyanobacterium T60_A2020_003]|nr:hypothetical protein [Synechococcales cyanobacterium T60_A2020_003]
MTFQPTDDSTPQATSLDADTVADLVRSLRRKEGNWVEWGKSCQLLQKQGRNPQAIFEDTGFEPVHQNQIIVAMQVFESIVSVGVSDAVRSHFEQRGSDSLYALRILTNTDRAAAATLLVERGIDSEGAREVAKAMRDFARLSTPPEGFESTAADAVAYHYWRLAKQQSDLQERSRLIAKALQFANSISARKQVEQLLTDFTVTRTRSAPMMPVYRVGSEEEMPRIVPVVGQFPITAADLRAVPLVDEQTAFRMVRFAGEGAWVAIPGWQVILNAEDPVAILTEGDRIPELQQDHPEEVLVIVDRAQRTWNADSYFLIDQGDTVQIQWSEVESEHPILGRVILILKPKRVLDENYTLDPWQMDE